MSEERRHTIHWYECSQHKRKLVRTCPECRAETGFDDAAWDYREAKERGVVLPLALCSHGNVKGKCPANCSQDSRGAKNNGPGSAIPRAVER